MFIKIDQKVALLVESLSDTFTEHLCRISFSWDTTCNFVEKIFWEDKKKTFNMRQMTISVNFHHIVTNFVTLFFGGNIYVRTTSEIFRQPTRQT